MGSQEMVPSGGQQTSHHRVLLLPAASAKPRLKWTRQLHEQFVDAISQLGGADKATPKSVMRIMGIPGLTLYHLKSHLQKYRLARNRDSSMLCENGEQDGNCGGASLEDTTIHDEERSGTQPDYNEDMLKMQMEVQRKLQEQIEVQKHLQLRIEAQGKYLQTVLKKAQETLAGYNLDTMGFDAAKAELSELVSAVETECLSSSSSQDAFFLMKRAPHGDCSTESCLTTSDAPEPKDAASRRQECSSSALNLNEDCEESDGNGRKRLQMVDANELCASKRNYRMEINGAEHLKEDGGSGHEPQDIDLNR